MNPSLWLPRRLRQELDATGLPWTAEHRSRHVQVRLQGHVVAVVTRCRNHGHHDKGLANNLASVRRMARQLKERA